MEQMPTVPQGAAVPGALDIYDQLPAAYKGIDPHTRGRLASRLPSVVFIEVTNHCNLLCETCPRTFTTYEEPKMLSWENFLRITGQFPTMQRAVLHGIGEPLMNKELPRMIAHLKARNVTVLFNTNATLLTESWGRDLIASGLDELRCSVDGADPRTYALVRGVPAFHKVMKNLQAFTALQRELQAEKPRVSLWMTGMKENIAELPDLVRLAARIGVPEVYLQRMVYYLDGSAPPGMMAEGHALFDDFDSRTDRIIAEAEVMAQQVGVRLQASGATDPRHSLDRGKEERARPWAACMRPWTTAYVTANGNCLPCCISPFATTEYESLKMGNLFDQPFTQVWNAEKYQIWRETLLSDAPHTACAGCGVHWSL
ncbi:MAG: radical SAM/SPASM domain-containing protein [Chloroflexi bacterium]|nr:radical SAM/SPASM domain-containing protein [Chloroflexota bacterium]